MANSGTGYWIQFCSLSCFSSLLWRPPAPQQSPCRPRSQHCQSCCPCRCLPRHSPPRPPLHLASLLLWTACSALGGQGRTQLQLDTKQPGNPLCPLAVLPIPSSTWSGAFPVSRSPMLQLSSTALCKRLSSSHWGGRNQSHLTHVPSNLFPLPQLISPNIPTPVPRTGNKNKDRVVALKNKDINR